MNIKRMNSFPVGKAVVALFVFFAVGLLAAIFVAQTLGAAVGADEITLMKLAAVFQNLLGFLLPAVMVGLLFWGAPLRFLGMTKRPTWAGLLGMAVIYVAMTPAMNWLVAWNESLTLPESLSGLEQWLRVREDAARAATGRMLMMDTPFDMLLTVLYVGVLTGLCEEAFFRGALQRILSSGKTRRHLAVWTAAVVFSLLHFQFYGFVPRVLLGAFFGYMFLWSGSLWVAVAAHVLNNSAVVILTFLNRKEIVSADLNQFGAAAGDGWIAAVSAVLAVVLIFGYRRMLKTQGHGA